MRLLPIWTVAAIALLLTTWSAPAQQMTREEIELRNQVYQLQQQVQALQAQMARQGGGSYLGQPGGYTPPQAGSGNDIVAELLTQVQTLSGEVRDLRGQIDQTQNQLKQQVAALNKRIDDLAFQMQNPGAAPPVPATPGEEAPPAGPTPLGVPAAAPGAPQPPAQTLSPPPAPLGATQATQPTPLGATQAAPPAPAGATQATPPAPAGATQATPPTSAPPPAPAHLTPEQDIQRGNAALARHDYAEAEAAARDVLNNHRTSPRAYEAQYMLAQALAGERRFAQAAIAFDDTYNRNRKGSRAPDALVGLASSLTAINEKRAACDTLVKLHTEFPQLRPEVRDEAASIRQRAACR